MKKFLTRILWHVVCSGVLSTHVVLANVHVAQPIFQHARFYAPPGEVNVITDPRALFFEAHKALEELKRREEELNVPSANPARFAQFISLGQTRQTLKFLLKTIQQDVRRGDNVFRILDPVFLNKHFSCVAWHADDETAKARHVALPGDGQIRLTHYGVIMVPGSRKKSSEYPCAIYQVFDKPAAAKFTKQEVLDGAIERIKHKHHHYRALAWVSRASLERALMHGTVVVQFDGDESRKQRILNVQEENGIPYDHHIKDRRKQARYWYFRDMAPTQEATDKMIMEIKKRSKVVLAGDIDHIGYGKLIALQYTNTLTQTPELRLALLVDTGGAFKDNTYQLDYFMGLVGEERDLTERARGLPIYARASILYAI